MNIVLKANKKKLNKKKNDSMQMKSAKKTQFAAVNDKSLYFHGEIVSLPFGHFLLDKVKEAKEKHWADLRTKIKKKVDTFLALECRAVHLCERLRVLRSIYAQPPLGYSINSQALVQIKSSKSTTELIINGSSE